jgi:hypothetical protein
MSSDGGETAMVATAADASLPLPEVTHNESIGTLPPMDVVEQEAPADAVAGFGSAIPPASVPSSTAPRSFPFRTTTRDVIYIKKGGWSVKIHTGFVVGNAMHLLPKSAIAGGEVRLKRGDVVYVESRFGSSDDMEILAFFCYEKSKKYFCIAQQFTSSDVICWFSVTNITGVAASYDMNEKDDRAADEKVKSTMPLIHAANPMGLIWHYGQEIANATLKKRKRTGITPRIRVDDNGASNSPSVATAKSATSESASASSSSSSASSTVHPMDEKRISTRQPDTKRSVDPDETETDDDSGKKEVNGDDDDAETESDTDAATKRIKTAADSAQALLPNDHMRLLQESRLHMTQVLTLGQTIASLPQTSAIRIAHAALVSAAIRFSISIPADPADAAAPPKPTT